MFTLIRIFWNRHLNIVRKIKHNRFVLRPPVTCHYCGYEDIMGKPYIAKTHGYIATFCDSTCHGVWTTQLESVMFAEWVDGE